MVNGRTAPALQAGLVPMRILGSLLLPLWVLASTAHGWTGPGGRIIENRGQLPASVTHYAYSGEATVYFTQTGVVIDLPVRGQAVRLRFVDAQPPSRIDPRNEQPSRLNSFLGNDPARWKTDLRVFSELVYRDLWPGVDVIFQAGEGAVRYQVLAAAGEESESGRWEERFAFDGVDGITNSATGTRQLEVPGGSLTDSPVSSDGADRVLRWGAVAGTPSESMDGGNDLGRDNPSTLSWSTFLGGADNDYGHGLALDSFQRPVVVGYTRSTNFPTTVGAYDRSQAGSYDVFVAKLDATGSTLLWATFVGGALEDRPFSVALDATDNVVVAGHAYSSDFPTTSNAHDRILNGPRDAFVFKLNASGSVLQWSTFLGGGSYERAWNLVLDSSGRPVVVGETASADFPTTVGAFDTVFGASWDSFVTKLDAAGQTLVWSTFLGGSSSDWALCVALDSQERPVVVGNTYSSDYPTTPEAFDRTANGNWDGFLTTLDAQGSSLVGSTYLGGSNMEDAFAVRLNASGHVVVAGSTSSADFPVTPGAYDVSFNGGRDVFVAQFDATGTNLLWNTFIGGSDVEESFAMILDLSGCAIVSGETASSDYPTTADGFDRSYAGNRDAFIARVSPTGSALLWSTYLGGSQFDSGWDFALDTSGNALLTGPTRSPEFTTTTGAYDRSYNGGDEDVFLLRLAIPPFVSATPAGQPIHVSAPTMWAGPNPFHSALQLRLDLPQPTTISLQVLDAAGRRVASVASGLRQTGVNSMIWSGRDAQNRPLNSGVYWLRLEAGPTIVQTKVVCVR